MRTPLKRDILSVINTLYHAHDEIKNNINRKQYKSAQDLISQCQECAISIGTTIEEFEGKDIITIHYIEEYCEHLYRIYGSLSVDSTFNAHSICKQSNMYLLKIENSIRNDIIAKKEIVFLPYKASMWDSLESVWKAADEDPECNAYVIPIPYYDKNPDGTLKCEYYEGNNFPPEVPITHYENYDFKNRHPDAIFIHNPYDQNNYVTTVHPFFYSDKLKEYGKKLIYIPYYVSTETNPNNYEAMEDRAGYVLSNGVIRSDMVFVQSENTKKLFVNILAKNVSGIDRSYWEKKIFGLGSPKFDRVNNMQRDDTKLSEQWKKIIYTSCGVRKKTIFYNISISTLLNHPEILEKIKDTLHFFRKNKDVAFWWRPHPLYESTLASMRPYLLKEYREIVSKYKKEGWGIFDDGVDLNWAISETDAYYGDSSSVVQLYKEIQKPVMIQNTQVRAIQKIKAEDIPIWPSTFFIEKEDIWFIHGKINILMRYNFKENYTYVVSKIPNEIFFKENSYQGIYKWKDKIFLIPCWARQIAIYDIPNNTFQKISLKNIENYHQKLLFCRVYMFDKYLYCIPYQYEAILKINLESMDLEYINIVEGLQTENYNISNFLISDAVQIGNEVAAVFARTNKILFFDMKTSKFRIRSGEKEREYTNITSLNKMLYIYDKGKQVIVRWTNNSPEKEEIFFTTPVENIVLSNLESRYIVLDCNRNTEFMILDEKGSIILHDNSIEVISKKSLDYSYYEGIENESMKGNQVYYFVTSKNTLYQFENGEVKYQYTFSLTYAELEKIKIFIKHKLDAEVAESELYNINSWIDLIRGMNTLGIKSQKSCGEKILNKVKELI